MIKRNSLLLFAFLFIFVGSIFSATIPVFWHKAEIYTAPAETGQTMSAYGTPDAGLAKWGNGLRGNGNASVINTSISGLSTTWSLTYTFKSSFSMVNGVPTGLGGDGVDIQVGVPNGFGTYGSLMYVQFDSSGIFLGFGAVNTTIADATLNWSVNALISIAITADTSKSTKFRFYINGVEKYSSTTGQNLGDGWICFPGYWQNFHSSHTCVDFIDNVKLYNVELTPAEVIIDRDYENGKPLARSFNPNDDQ